MEGGLQPSPTTLGARQRDPGRVCNEIHAGKTGRLRPETQPRTLPQAGGETGLRSATEPRAEGDALDTAIARARARGAKWIAELFKSQDMLNEQEFGSLVGASHETIAKWRASGEVLALHSAAHGLRYPQWQITDDGRLLPGLKELTAELNHPWAIYRFLLQGHPELRGITGLECLKAGRIGDAVQVAVGIGQGSFS